MHVCNKQHTRMFFRDAAARHGEPRGEQSDRGPREPRPSNFGASFEASTSTALAFADLRDLCGIIDDHSDTVSVADCSDADRSEDNLSLHSARSAHSRRSLHSVIKDVKESTRRRTKSRYVELEYDDYDHVSVLPHSLGNIGSNEVETLQHDPDDHQHVGCVKGTHEASVDRK